MATTFIHRMSLGDICDFQIGHNVRGKLVLSGKGVQVVQLKDLPPTGDFKVCCLGRAELGEVSDRYVVEDGDVVFRTRFEPNVAYRLSGLEGQAVVLAPALILRPKSSVADPDYLVWYIRQSPAQGYIEGIRQGTNLQQIPLEDLKRLPVELPPIEAQRRIVSVSQLSDREHALRLEIAAKRQAITSFALLQQMRKTQPHKSGLGPKPSEGAATPEDISLNRQ